MRMIAQGNKFNKNAGIIAQGRNSLERVMGVRLIVGIGDGAGVCVGLGVGTDVGVGVIGARPTAISVLIELDAPLYFLSPFQLALM